MLATKTSVLNYLDIKVAYAKAIKKGLMLPEPNSIEMYGTTNNFGFMFGKFDQVVKDFLEEIKSHTSNKFEILEIGCAYGNVVRSALNSGCAGYIASDISEEHLQVLARQIVEEKFDSSKLKILQGSFPQEINLPKNSIKFGLMNKVLHFFQPKDLSAVMERLKDITAEGGKWFVLTASPFSKTFQNFGEEYKKRQKLGFAYPGFCPNAGDYSADRYTSDNLPFSMLFLELADLCTLFESYGFRICKTYSLDLPCEQTKDWTFGQDMVGVVAEKISD